jgi:C-terminal processing protease CtpA/Prc
MYRSLKALDTEIAALQANTDVLVVDVMRNPGGDVCLAEDILSRLTTKNFFGAWAETRVTWSDILDVNYDLATAGDFGYTEEDVAQLKDMQAEYQEAYQKNEGRTKPMPICAAGGLRSPVASAYTKPVLLLTDEMSASSADIFAAMVQDNHIAPIFGYRTMGAGGSPEGDHPGVYSEGYTTLTRSLVVRAYPVVTPDFPTTGYIENVGVRADIPADYMTADNLLNRGDAFVKAFTAEAAKLARPN